jgi:DNA-binding CsgD family transcriptional regulator
LRPLTAEGTKRALAKRWPLLPDDVVAAVHHLTCGHPFLLDVVAADIARAELSAGSELSRAAYARIADWVTRQAVAADEHSPSLLHAIAVLGDGCEVRHAAALIGAHPEAVLDTVDRLSEVEILAPGATLRFVYPVVADAIAAVQPSGALGKLHRRAALRLADDDAAAEVVAGHLLDATRTGSAWVADALSAAASCALDRGAPGDAVLYLRRALDEPPPRQRRADLALELGRVEALAGEPQAGVRLSDAVRDVGDHRLDQPEKALAAGNTLVALGCTEDALAAFRRGLAHASETSSDVAGRLSAGVATIEWLTNLWSDGDQAQVPLPAGGDTPGDRALLALHAFQATVRGDPRGGVREMALCALADGALLADESSDGLSYYMAVLALAHSDEIQLAEDALASAIDEAMARGSVLGFATASLVRATTLYLAGALPEAATAARHAVSARREGWRMGLGGAHVTLANVCLEQSDLAGAARHLVVAEAAMGEPDPFHPALLAARGRVQLYSGDADAARATLLASGELAECAGIRNPSVAPWRADAGLATHLAGDWVEGERMIEDELAAARAFGAPGPIGRALRALASIQPPQAARELLREAVMILEHSSAALERAAALVDLGAALRRSSQRRKALELLREGLDQAERCGASGLVERTLREMHAAGGRPRRAAIHGTAALTRRERQVASLAADGLSNREIAEALVVTVKTVEWHLRHVFEKLEVGSRADLRGKLGTGAETAL